MKYVAEKYSELCKTPSDINEHLPILYNHAKKCESVFETGVRGAISSWALIYGLLSNKDISAPRIFMNDIYECDLTEILEKTKKLDIKISYKWCNNLTLDFDKEKQSDVRIESQGIIFIMNKESEQLAKGAKIDYLDTLNESGFRISNPNAEESCGCGKSFG